MYHTTKFEETIDIYDDCLDDCIKGRIVEYANKDYNEFFAKYGKQFDVSNESLQCDKDRLVKTILDVIVNLKNTLEVLDTRYTTCVGARIINNAKSIYSKDLGYSYRWTLIQVWKGRASSDW